MYKINGKWNENVRVLNEETQEEFKIWEPNPKPENSYWLHNFTKFALQLNHLPE